MLPLLRTPLQMLLTGAGAAGGGAAPFVGVLDPWNGGNGAWSLYRRLLSSYTGALWRGRRGGDDAEMDMTPQADGTLNKAGVEAWSIAGGGDGSVYVVTLYDQSGNGNDLEQSTAGAQMIACETGAMIVTGSYDYPAMRPTNTNVSMYASQTWSPNYTGQNLWLFTNENLGYDGAVWNSISISKDSDPNWASQDAGVPLTAQAGSFSGVRAGVFSAGNWPTVDGLQLITATFSATGWRAAGSTGGADDFLTPQMQGAFNANRFLLGAFGPSSPYGSPTVKWVESVCYLADMAADESSIQTALTLP